MMSFKAVNRKEVFYLMFNLMNQEEVASIGNTQNKWDSIIPFEPMWERIKKLRKDTTPIIIGYIATICYITNFVNRGI